MFAAFGCRFTAAAASGFAFCLRLGMANPGSLRQFSEAMGLAVGGVVCQYPGLLGEEPPSYTCPWYSSLDLLQEVPDLAIHTRGSLGHFEADFAIDSANRGIPSACDPSRPICLSSCR